jgi:hypothetical protein
MPKITIQIGRTALFSAAAGATASVTLRHIAIQPSKPLATPQRPHPPGEGGAAPYGASREDKERVQAQLPYELAEVCTKVAVQPIEQGTQRDAPFRSGF